MLNGKEGRLLRRNNDKDANMKINILLCDDDKDFLQRISDTVAGQPVPPGASICITKSSNPAEITDRQLSQYHIMFLDIDMDERSGMDIARRVRECNVYSIVKAGDPISSQAGTGAKAAQLFPGCIGRIAA